MTESNESLAERRKGAASVPPVVVGRAAIEAVLKTMATAPGVYRMLGTKDEPLYVGKAKNLKKRLRSYTKPTGLSTRLQRMVAQTRSVEVVTTHTEVEALLLEANFIKRLKPRFNVILRDDKSLPDILITGDHAFPQIVKHRGARSRKGEYFGPFASAGAVNQTLSTLQRAFLLRSCSDGVFEARTRPCLLYQIKRCSGPCVGLVSRDDYLALVDEARGFLSGRSHGIQRSLSERMDAASAVLEFEKAAMFRDRIRALAHVQAHQGVNVAGLGAADVIAAHQEAGQSCVQVFFFRGGQNFGNRAYFPSHARALGEADLLAAFLGQFYQNKEIPPLVLVSHEPAEKALLEEALTLHAGRRVRLVKPGRGAKRSLVEHALSNAREALARHLAESASQRRLLDAVASRFGLDTVPRRIEVYDNSHIAGAHALGSMIVAGAEGLVKSAYRKFTIRGTGTGAITPGDDYGMMREVLSRRFTRLIKEDPERESDSWPDLIIVDGGAGQVNTAVKVFADLGVGAVAVLGVAKGGARTAERERFFLPGRAPISLNERDPVLYFLQRLRDEAHRFAIGGHRAKRSKAIGRSLLDEIPGVGRKRKRALLHHFGSARAVGQAGLADLEQAEGVSKAVARLIYDHFHAQG